MAKEKEKKRWKRERSERGYSQGDWWNFDTYLAGIIADGVDSYRVMEEEFLQNTSDPELIAERKKAIKAYKKISREFRRYLERDHPLDEIEQEKKFKKAFDLLYEYFGHLWI